MSDFHNVNKNVKFCHETSYFSLTLISSNLKTQKVTGWEKKIAITVEQMESGNGTYGSMK